MDEERLNMEIRKFLKNVGITSQREIETAVRKEAAAGKNLGKALSVNMVLTVPEIGLRHQIDGQLDLG
ncbi:MAG: hypothetical protein JO111_14405 [Caulobacteraceae bacterium]|nr:hypothetical protein [Caulobacteraceae bacterium]